MQNIPSNYSKDLTTERIIALSSFLATIRGEVIDRHDPLNLGDTPLALGLRAYECCRTRLIAQDKMNTWSWLSILVPEGKFTILVGDTPVRFVRSSPGGLPEKKFIRPEEVQTQIDWLEEEKPEASIHWFIVIDTHYLNPADTIYFVGYSDNQSHDVICKWEVPLEDKVNSLTEVTTILPQAIKIDEAPVKIKKKTNIKAIDE